MLFKFVFILSLFGFFSLDLSSFLFLSNFSNSLDKLSNDANQKVATFSYDINENNDSIVSTTSNCREQVNNLDDISVDNLSLISPTLSIAAVATRQERLRRKFELPMLQVMEHDPNNRTLLNYDITFDFVYAYF